MATFDKLPSGRWRVQVRRKGQTASRSFRLKSDAETWASEAEDNIERGRSVDATSRRLRRPPSNHPDCRGGPRASTRNGV